MDHKDNVDMSIQAQPSELLANSSDDQVALEEPKKGRFAYFKTPQFYLVLAIG